MAEHVTRCSIHDAPFKEGVTRWCKKSNPSDTCVVDTTSLPPRQLPVTALLILGAKAEEPGWLIFLMEAKKQGFGLDQAGDHDLSEDRWRDVAVARVSALARAFDLAVSNR